MLSDGIDITNNIEDDVVSSSVPDDMQPLREKFIAALDKRIEAYYKLFLYYDFLREKDKADGEKMLKDSLLMFNEIKKKRINFVNRSFV